MITLLKYAKFRRLGQFILLLLLSNILSPQAIAADRQAIAAAANELPVILQGVDCPELGQKLRQTISQAWADTENLLAGNRLHPAGPLTMEINFIAEPRSFSCLFRGPTPSGILHVAESRAVLHLNRECDLRSQQVVRHEIAHWLLRQYWKENFASTDTESTYSLPSWLDEGIACTLEIPLSKHGQTQMHPERCSQFLQLAERRKCAVRFARILLPAHKISSFASDEYAFSWAIVFYLSRQCSCNGNTALLSLLQACLENTHFQDGEPSLDRYLFKLVNPPLESSADMFQQILTWLKKQPR
jgi:hypothetical protein